MRCKSEAAFRGWGYRCEQATDHPGPHQCTLREGAYQWVVTWTQVACDAKGNLAGWPLSCNLAPGHAGRHHCEIIQDRVDGFDGLFVSADWRHNA